MCLFLQKNLQFPFKKGFFSFKSIFLQKKCLFLWKKLPFPLERMAYSCGIKCLFLQKKCISLERIAFSPKVGMECRLVKRMVGDDERSGWQATTSEADGRPRRAKRFFDKFAATPLLLYPPPLIKYGGVHEQLQLFRSLSRIVQKL